MPFGISFGSNRSRGSSDTTVNRTETQDQTQTGTRTSTGTTATSGASTTQSTQAGTTTQAGTSTQATTGSQTSELTSQQFSDNILADLESAVQNLFGSIPSPEESSFRSNFDSDRFIAAGMDAATSRVNMDLESGLNSMFDQIGGRDDDNSMATLLANRARSDAAASLAGTRAQLTGQAEQIGRENFLANLQGVGQSQGFLGNLLTALRGGRATQIGAVQTAEETAGATTATGANTLTGSESTQTQETQIQQLAEALNQILRGTTTLTGTESTDTRGRTSGFGLGLSI